MQPPPNDMEQTTWVFNRTKTHKLVNKLDISFHVRPVSRHKLIFLLVGFGSRHIFAFMAFLGLAVTYMMRVNLSVAIVDMVRTPAPFPTSINASLLDHTSHCPIKVTQHPVRKVNPFLLCLFRVLLVDTMLSIF